MYGQDDAEGALDVLSEHMSEESQTIEDHMNDLVCQIDDKDKDMFSQIRADVEKKKRTVKRFNCKGNIMFVGQSKVGGAFDGPVGKRQIK